MKQICIFVSMILILALFGISPSSGTEGRDNTFYTGSMNIMRQLGIFSGNERGDMEPDRPVTREEFAKLIVTVTGQEGNVNLYQNNSLFPDVPVGRWSNGYIGAAIAFGYLTPMPDGRFHPAQPVTYSQSAVTIGTLLGYSERDLKGSWPYNYLDLLKNLGIYEGIPYQPQQPVLRKHMAVILERMLQTEMHNENRLFLESTGIYHHIIVMENGKLRPDLDQRRLLTNKGIFFLREGVNMPEPGYSYIVRAEKGIVQAISERGYQYETYSVQGTSSGFVLLNDRRSLSLPKEIPWYYNGQTVDVSLVNRLLQTNSSLIVASKNGEKQYGLIYDPVYSKPRIITQDMSASVLERLYGGKMMDRGGKSISASQLEVNDVVYEVTDLWNRFGYILVVANEIYGDITAILPNKISPSSIKVGHSIYELSDSFPVNKINVSGTMEVGQTVTLLLGEDGKAVDIILSGVGANDHFVLVLNDYTTTSQSPENFGTKQHFVNLLHTNGSIKTYLTKTELTGFKGELAIFTVIEASSTYDTVELKKMETIQRQAAYEVFKDERRLDQSYIADNVVIFNLIHNVYGRNSDASILKWSDFPAGRLEASRVKFIQTSGEFQDIDVLFLHNILDQGIHYGLVTNLQTTYSRVDGAPIQNITMLIRGERHTFSTSPVLGASVGSVLRVRMSGGSILSAENIVRPHTEASSVEAVDSSRIRVNGTTYRYHRELAVYKVQSGGSWERVGTSQIEKESNVTLYLDKALSHGGRVVMVIIR